MFRAPRSSTGLGAAITVELARRGAHVLITYTSPESEKGVADLKQQIRHIGNGASTSSVRADLGDPSAPETIVEAVRQAFGNKIDILINNAGMEKVKPLTEIDTTDFDEVFHLYVRAPMLMTKAVLPFLREPGRIVNMSSVGARSGFENLSLYCSSKAALEGMTRAHAPELGMNGHTVNAVEPGRTESDMLEKIPPDLVA